MFKRKVYDKLSEWKEKYMRERAAVPLRDAPHERAAGEARRSAAWLLKGSQ